MLFKGKTAYFTPSVPQGTRLGWEHNGGSFVTKWDNQCTQYVFCIGPEDPDLPRLAESMVIPRHIAWIATCLADAFLLPIASFTVDCDFNEKEAEYLFLRAMQKCAAARPHEQDPSATKKRNQTQATEDDSFTEIDNRPIKRVRMDDDSSQDRRLRATTDIRKIINHPHITTRTAEDLLLGGPFSRQKFLDKPIVESLGAALEIKTAGERIVKFTNGPATFRPLVPRMVHTLGTNSCSPMIPLPSERLEKVAEVTRKEMEQTGNEIPEALEDRCEIGPPSQPEDLASRRRAFWEDFERRMVVSQGEEGDPRNASATPFRLCLNVSDLITGPPSQAVVFRPGDFYLGKQFSCRKILPATWEG